MFHYFGVFLILIAAKGLSGQSCHLNDSNMNESWVFTYDNDLLHTDVIPDQTALKLLCKHTRYGLTLWCNNGTLDTIPTTATCPKRFRASVNDMQITCRAHNMKGKLYEISYSGLGSKHTLLYDACYSGTLEAVLYVRHRAYGFNLPASNYVRPQFTQDYVVSPERAASFEAASVYDTFNTLLGVGQTYVKSPSDFAVQRGHLANALDFLTYDQMDETFKYVNAMPQFRDVNNGNWKAIETWTHKLPTQNTYANVTTGIFGTLQLPNTKGAMVHMYLMPEQKRNPIPMWTYKLVKYDQLCYGFVTLNNEKNNDTMITPSICQKTACPSDLKLNNDPGKGVTHCCDCEFLEKAMLLSY